MGTRRHIMYTILDLVDSYGKKEIANKWSLKTVLERILIILVMVGILISMIYLPK